MSLTKFWPVGFLVSLVVLVMACATRATAQTWHASAPSDSGTDDRTDSQDWEQRVLKHPETQQWRPVDRETTDDQATGTPARTTRGRDFNAQSGDQTAVRQVSAQSQDIDGGEGTARSIPVELSNSGRQPARWTDGEEMIETGAGQQQFEPLANSGEFAGPRGCAHCANRGGGDCDCGEPDGGCDSSCGCPPCGRPRGDSCDFGYELFDGTCGKWVRNFSFFAGADAFKGPLDRGTNGDYGFNAGLNYAGPLGDPWGCGFQIGANAVESDFSGAPTVTLSNGATLNAAERRQYFVTAGLFRRELCNGFQWGVAYDYLHDDFYNLSDLQQLRSESAFVFDGLWELGFYGAYGVSSAHVTGTTATSLVKIDPSDMFCLFARRNFENGGDGRLWGGATANGDGLIGADLWVPLGKGFALQNEVNYLIPKQGRGDVAEPRESWGFLVQLVWYPGQTAMCQHKNLYRPIFNVADNSLFMVDRLAHP